MPNLMANNTLKYRRIDPALREASCAARWNPPVLWPLWGTGPGPDPGALPALWMATGAASGAPAL